MEPSNTMIWMQWVHVDLHSIRSKSLYNLKQQNRLFHCGEKMSAGVNNTCIDGWIPFGCFSFVSWYCVCWLKVTLLRSCGTQADRVIFLQYTIQAHFDVTCKLTGEWFVYVCECLTSYLTNIMLTNSYVTQILPFWCDKSKQYFMSSENLV